MILVGNLFFSFTFTVFLFSVQMMFPNFISSAKFIRFLFIYLFIYLAIVSNKNIVRYIFKSLQEELCSLLVQTMILSSLTAAYPNYDSFIHLIINVIIWVRRDC